MNATGDKQGSSKGEFVHNHHQNERPHQSSPFNFSSDLILRIGTRTATITAVYERMQPRELPKLPVPPSSVVTSSSNITNITQVNSLAGTKVLIRVTGRPDNTHNALLPTSNMPASAVR